MGSPKMKKITDFTNITKYFCTECGRFHRKYTTRNKMKVIGKPFKNHKEYAVELTSTELWQYQFGKSWDRNKKYQKETGKPIGK